MPKPVARYLVTFGLPGCLPDSNGGTYATMHRGDLASFIRGTLEMYDLPKVLFRDVNLRRLWGFIKRHGSSTAHIAIHHGGYVLEFHGLTEAEYLEHNPEDGE